MLFLFTLLCGALSLGAQRTVSGTIVDGASQEPLIGVTVLQQGTSTGTVTDINGNFDLTVTGPDAVLVITYTGYGRQEVAIGNQTSIAVTLETDDVILEEVVVVGYGKVKKSDLTVRRRGRPGVVFT